MKSTNGTSEMTGIKQVAAGDRHTVVLTDNGYMYATGSNTYYQLSDGSGSQRKNLVYMRDDSNNLMKDVKEKIEDVNDKNLFEKFIKDVEIWLDKKKDFIKILKTLRDKYIAHRDDDYNAMEEVSLAMRSLKNDEFIEVSNTIISIYIYLIELISNIIVLSEGYYSFNEFNFIYECLRSLDKIKYKVTEKNMIIHNIDLELQQLKRLLGIRR